jgi:hypothetical protein
MIRSPVWLKLVCFFHMIFDIILLFTEETVRSNVDTVEEQKIVEPVFTNSKGATESSGARIAIGEFAAAPKGIFKITLFYSIYVDESFSATISPVIEQVADANQTVVVEFEELEGNTVEETESTHISLVAEKVTSVANTATEGWLLLFFILYAIFRRFWHNCEESFTSFKYSFAY